MLRGCVVVGCVVALGCGPRVAVPSGDDESTGAADTGPIGGSATGATTTAGPMSTSTSITTSGTSTSTTDASTGVDPDSSTSTTTIAGESSSDDDGCLPDTECSNDDDCGPGAECLACICFGCHTQSDGTYDGCVLGDGTIDTSVCNDDGAVCLVDAVAPTAGVCASPCTEVCDCPPPPGREAQLGCGDLDGDGTSECFLGCGGGCPPGMVCTSAAVCMWPV